MNYAFTFDASACTGCKACQVACKDKNNLPTGVLWRRVYEVTGGTWENIGADAVRPGTETGTDSIRPYAVWKNNIFAYNLSIACNHCVHPKCAGVCPTDAYVVRDDGIVYIDESKCMGCGYCSWACPYAAPQYNPDLRHMTKCNFCFDNIDVGLPPACVSACPMRVLNFVTVEEGPQILDDGRRTMDHGRPSTVHGSGFQTLWDTVALNHPFPLPEFSRTQPHLAIKPHSGMVNGLEKAVSNQEEARPQRHNDLEELPLIIFTLLGQMSAGMALFSLFIAPSTFTLLSIGILLGIGGLASFLHLGTKKNAWRAILHLRKSWLSREMLMSGLFGMFWLISLAEHWLLNTDRWLPVTAALGLGLVFSMARVYRLRAVSKWNSWRTDAAFFLTAGILGLLGVGLERGLIRFWLPLLSLLLAQLVLVLSTNKNISGTVNKWRVILILAGMTGVVIMALLPGKVNGWTIYLISIILLIELFIGRVQFYKGQFMRVM